MLIVYFLLVFAFFYVVFNLLPKLVPALNIRKGTKLILEKNYEEGLKYFKKGAMHKRIKPYTKLRYAFLELKYGDIKEAKKIISLIINDAFVDKKIKYEAKGVWALIAFIEGDLDEAQEVADNLYKKNYRTTDVYCTLGYIYNVVKTPEQAIEFNKEAMEYNPDKAVIKDNLAQAYYLNGDYDMAERLSKEVVDTSPRFPEGYYNYALVLMKKGDRKKAKEMLNEALTKEFHNLTTITKEQVLNLLEGNESDVG